MWGRGVKGPGAVQPLGFVIVHIAWKTAPHISEGWQQKMHMLEPAWNMGRQGGQRVGERQKEAG
jgi:hypothetical protein